MRSTELDRIAEIVVTSGAAPGAAVASARREGDRWLISSGIAGAASGVPHDPVFDLASVTKSFVATTAARLSSRGGPTLEATLGSLVPELGDTPSGEVSLLLLLSHRAGLDAHRSLFAPLVAGRTFSRARALREAAMARRPDARGTPPAQGFPPLYSDLGYVLAGAALERATGLPLDELVERELVTPLGLDVHSARRWFVESPDFLARVLPTETMAFRGGSIRGAVHDENAWALAGHGLAGQAGLFGTADAVVRFGAALLDALAGRAGSLLSPAELTPLVAERPGGSLRAGFDGKSGPASAAGALASTGTFGHLGFTGTSLWCDPQAERVTVLLSNRVSPSRENLRIRAIRPMVHDALFGWQGGLV
jgi:CubicO group peptidase (beta-lactamase class C family)